MNKLIPNGAKVVIVSMVDKSRLSTNKSFNELCFRLFFTHISFPISRLLVEYGCFTLYAVHSAEELVPCYQSLIVSEVAKVQATKVLMEGFIVAFSWAFA